MCGYRSLLAIENLSVSERFTHDTCGYNLRLRIVTCHLASVILSFLAILLTNAVLRLCIAHKS